MPRSDGTEQNLQGEAAPSSPDDQTDRRDRTVQKEQRSKMRMEACTKRGKMRKGGKTEIYNTVRAVITNALQVSPLMRPIPTCRPSIVGIMSGKIYRFHLLSEAVVDWVKVFHSSLALCVLCYANSGLIILFPSA